MDTRKPKLNGKITRVLALLCIFVLMLQLAPTTAYARTKEEVEAEIVAKREELDAIAETIKQNKNNREAAQEGLKKYQEEYDNYMLLIAEKEELIQDTEALLDVKVEELNQTVESIHQNEELYAERLRAIYEINSTGAVLSVLLSVDSFSDFVQAQDAIKRISKRDTELLEELAELREQYEKQKLELETLIDNMNEELQKLQEDRDWAAGKMQEMKNLIASANYQIQMQEAEREQTEEEIAELQRELARIFAELESSGTSSGDTSVKYDGPLVWPVSGYSKVSSYFGDYRSNTRYHYGIDIPAPEGTGIQACGSGTVQTATWHYSYGYYIVIDHGQGLRTLYAHCSSLYVSAGQTVAVGETIAAVGNTGDSYGAHLHLEVHEHGTRQNPLGSGYLNQ